MKKITIIIPAYNEEESLPMLYERLNKLMNEVTNYEFEVLFVNDGSKDKTINTIKSLSKLHHDIKYFSFSKESSDM